MLSGKLGIFLRKHPGKKRNASHSLVLIGAFQFKFQLRQDREQNTSTNMVKLVDQIVNLCRDEKLFVFFTKDQDLIEKLLTENKY